MIWFWPQRKSNEISETQEDPYDDKNEEKPAQERVSSSDEDSDGDLKKRFGEFPDSDESSEDSVKIEELKEFAEVKSIQSDDGEETENDNEVEYEVRMDGI